MKPNTMLLNQETTGGITTFTVWADTLACISAFIRKAISIKGIPNELKYSHDIGMGYWVHISVPENTFNQVVTDIKNIFENNQDNLLCVDFTQKQWAADMLSF